MTTDDMASRLSVYRSLVPQLSSALSSFQSSGSKFKVLKTVHPTNLTPHDPQPPTNEESPRTLFILDSSFNPPSIAHQALAQSALHKNSSDVSSKPHRLLLLFATMNADKAPSAAAFEQRLTLMTVFAGDLIQNLRAQSDKYSVVPVDIGVTTVPYYTDKSAAIASSAWYPDSPKHIHLVGYDTLTRFFAAKYYKDFNPPFSALDPYFDAGHRLRITLRPDDEYGSEAEQRAFVQSLEKGDMEKDGGNREWAKQLDLVPPNPKAGVSSTKVRKAAKAGEWSKVHELCTEGVMQYVKSEKLYDEDDRGAKMA